jgi:hypothetical protein
MLADKNDADYIGKLTLIENINEELSLQKISEIFKKSKDNYNWPTGNCDEINEKSPREAYRNELSNEDFRNIEKFIPYDENGIHTIESIIIIETDKVENIFGTQNLKY